MKMSKPRLELLLFNEEQPTEVVDSQETTEVEEVQSEPESFLEIQYNKEMKNITADEAKELAEMGMFYKEKGKEKLSAYESRINELENSPELKFMNDFLKQNGFNSFNEYQEALELQEIKKDNEALTDEQAKMILEGRRAREERERNDQRTLEEQRAKQAKEEQDDAMVAKFAERFPDVKGEEIPQEVWDMVKDGIDLSIAYELHQLRQGTDRSKIEQEVLSKLQQNNDTSTGSASKGSPSHESSIQSKSKDEFQKMVEAVKRGEIKEI